MVQYHSADYMALDRWMWAAVALCSWACGAQPASLEALTPPLVITNVAVIPMDVPGVEYSQTVVVRDGVIVEIVPSSSASIPDGARIIDGSGKYLLPGFADMHVHLWRQATLDLLLANGVTVARDMNGYPMFLRWREEIERDQRSGPRLILASRIFEGTPPPEHADVIITEGRIIVDDSTSAADSVASQVAQGYDLIKVYNNLNLMAYRGIVSEARRLGTPVVGHVPLAVGLTGAFDAGQQTIEHLRGYVLESVPADGPDPPGADYRSRLLAWRHADTAMLRTLAARTTEHGTWNVPTLATFLDLLPADRIGELTGRPGWQRCMRGSRSDPIGTRARIPYLAVMTDEDFAAAQEGVVVQKKLVRFLHEAGARLLVGTDRLPWGFAFHWEMEEMVDAGLTPWDVLRAATYGAAQYLNQDNGFGSVRHGMVAELVLLDANPLEDIRNTKKIAAVVSHGRLIEKAELEAMKEAACQALAN